MEDKNLPSPQSPDLEARRTIKELAAENRRLSHENDELKKELSELRGKPNRKTHSDKYQALLERRSDVEYMYSKKNYPAFMCAQLKHTSFFHIYNRVITVFRRYSFITTSLKVFSIVFLLIEATLLVFVSTSVFIASLLSILFFSQIFALFTVFSRRRHNRENSERLKGKKVCVFFPPRDRAFDYGSYFSGLVREASKGEDKIAVIVSPYTIKSVGLDKSRHIYFICRGDGKNVLLVRRNYWFSMKKRVVDKVCASVTEIY